MNRNALLSASVLAVAATLAFAPAIARAADADRPYSNIDHHNDAGNNTGDSQVDQLNAQQLDQNYWATHSRTATAAPTYPQGYQPQAYPTTSYPAPGYNQAPPAYAPPVGGYPSAPGYPPPPGYAPPAYAPAPAPYPGR